MFMDIVVASKYRKNLSNLTYVITDDVRSTLESFKTNVQNALPRQIRSVVQQVQGEGLGKLLDLAHSTPYLGNTSAPSNMGTLFPGSTTAPGNKGVLANTSTPHLGSTSGNVIYVDASSPYLGSTFMGNLGGGGFLLLAYLTRGAHPLRVNWGYLHTLPNRTRV
jgi:hypothetical protein